MEASWIKWFRIIAIALILLFAVFFIGQVIINYSNGYQVICADNGWANSGSGCSSPAYLNENSVLFYEYLFLNLLIIAIILFLVVKFTNYLCTRFQNGFEVKS